MEVTGKIKVFKFEDKGKYGKASLGESTKGKDGTWNNKYYNAKFFKGAFDKAKENGMPDKTKIEIKKAFLDSSTWNGKTYVSVNIMDFDYVDGVSQKTEQAAEQQTSDFVDVDLDAMASELPF